MFGGRKEEEDDEEVDEENDGAEKVKEMSSVGKAEGEELKGRSSMSGTRRDGFNQSQRKCKRCIRPAHSPGASGSGSRPGEVRTFLILKAAARRP